jgi:hypothetical protein
MHGLAPDGKRAAAPDWAAIASGLDERGHATVPGFLAADRCAAIAALYEETARFRSRIVMERHAYGVGEYQYFAYPLPDAIQALREELYRGLAPIANAWARRLGQEAAFPPDLETFLRGCRAAGQGRPTPLLLRYDAGGYNCLHQDRYGAIAFPLQATVLLSRPGEDFAGGEFLLVEQRPRAQSRGEVVALSQGDAVIFANALRPVRGQHGDHRVNLRHGVSRVASGRRFTLGLIFHDAA